MDENVTSHLEIINIFHGYKPRMFFCEIWTKLRPYNCLAKLFLRERGGWTCRLLSKAAGGAFSNSARQLREPSPKLLPDSSWRTSRLPVLSRKLPALSGQRSSSGQGLHAMQWKLHLVLNPAWAHMIVPAVFVHPTFPLTPALHDVYTANEYSGW